MKGTLDTRPIYVWTDEHIEAHLILYTIAIIVVRLIQNKIVEFKGKDKTKNWTSGLPGERLQNSLNKWKVELYNDGYYKFCDLDEPDLKLILDSFDIYYSRFIFKSSVKRNKEENRNFQVVIYKYTYINFK